MPGNINSTENWRISSSPTLVERKYCLKIASYYLACKAKRVRRNENIRFRQVMTPLYRQHINWLYKDQFLNSKEITGGVLFARALD